MAGPERMGNETGVGEFRSLPVADGETVAADTQLAGDTERHGLAVLVEDIGFRVGDGAADGDGGRRCFGFVDFKPGGEGGGLRGAVNVEQTGAACAVGRLGRRWGPWLRLRT